MKLWVKLSLSVVILITAAISLCGLLMLVSTGKSNIDYAIKGATVSQRACISYLTNAIKNEVTSATSVATEKSLLRYFASQLSDTSIILCAYGEDYEVLYNMTDIEPGEHITLTGNTLQYVITEVKGKNILLLGSVERLGKLSYAIYATGDITPIYSQLDSLSSQFVLINLIVIVITIFISILLVRTILKPIRNLKENTALIADGVLDKRIQIAENDEIGSLAMDFNTMAAAIEKMVDELKDEAERRTMFMSALTHELKTPMTSIKGNSEMLLATKLNEEEKEQAILQINEDCTRVEKLTYKLMQLIVLKKSNDITPIKNSTDTLFDMVSRASLGQLKVRELSLITKNEQPYFIIDIDLMCGLLLNLIDNAGKASKPGDVIELIARDNYIAVKDYGCGIPKKELDLITQPFYMVDKSHSRKLGGIGLGLALVDEIVRLHGAKLEFESEVGVGTTVKIVFADDKEASNEE